MVFSGSTVALQAITSFGALATLLSYYLTIATFISYRLRCSKLPVSIYRRWIMAVFLSLMKHPGTSMVFRKDGHGYQHLRYCIPHALDILPDVAAYKTSDGAKHVR